MGFEDVFWNDPKTKTTVAIWVDKDSELAKEVPEDRHYNKKKNLEALEKLKDTVALSDGVVVTQPILGELWEPYNGNIIVMPNAIDFNKFTDVKLQRSKKTFRIGWAGGCSHWKDFRPFAEAIKTFLNTHREAVLVLAGQGPSEFFHDVPADQIELHGWVHFEAHPFRTSLLDLDVAIIPLEDTSFNRCKSPVKYLEFAATGVPCIVQKNTPYKEVVTDMVDALTFTNPAEFSRCLNKSYTDPILMMKLRKTAHDNVKKNFNADDWAKKYVDILTKMVGEKNGPISDKE
jgi:glycosyltransferase involved in cell wall biosynthesis